MQINELLSLLRNVKKCGKGWTARCPAHDDHHNSLSISEENGKILLNCFKGCDKAQILDALNLSWKDLFNNDDRGGCTTNGFRGDTVSKQNKNPAKPTAARDSGDTGFDTPVTPPGVKSDTPVSNGLTLIQLAQAKKLHVEFLRELGLREVTVQREKCVKIPYFDESGNEIAVRFRTALAGGTRFKWRRGDKINLYGLWRLEEAKKAGYVLLVEGESDCWTCWYHGIPALGIPGKSTWRSEWKDYIKDLTVYLWCEPDAFDLVERVAKDVPNLQMIYAPEYAKDPSELHLSGNFSDQIQNMLDGAVLAMDEIALKQSTELARWAEEARPVLESDDPLVLVEKAIREMGYGGNVGQPLTIYLAFASRLLKMRHGTMPVHLLVKGPPSAGKSYAVQIITCLHPPEAYHVIDAGSPRVLIYDDTDLKHKALIFSEADSLPIGEDNPAASAIRGLLQDNYLHYQTTVRDPETGDFKIREITKEGPTALITSAVKSLGEQLMTRLFILDVQAENDQIKSALAAQAMAEINGTSGPDPALIAYQAYLQAKAPWDVVVPFADKLAEAIAPAARPRILRDFQRLLSLIKSVTVLRHRHREKENGRLVATIEDYAFIYELVKEMYTTTVSGCSENVRRTVEAVAKLKEKTDTKITYSLLAKELGVHRDLARRWAKTAIGHGWLVNKADKGRVADLDIGEPLPERIGLPDPTTLCHRHKNTGVKDGDINENPGSLKNSGLFKDEDKDDTMSPGKPIDINTPLGGIDLDDIPF